MDPSVLCVPSQAAFVVHGGSSSAGLTQGLRQIEVLGGFGVLWCHGDR